MRATTIQELVLQGANLVCEEKLQEACNFHKDIIKALRSYLDAAGQNTVLPEMNQMVIVFQPISDQDSHVSPAWDEEKFAFPFSFVVQESILLSNEEHRVDQNKIVTACASVCLFNLGLCSQMQATDQKEDCGAGLRNAIRFYKRAWATLQPIISGLDGSTPATTLIFLMAICTNLSNCYYHLGELDSARCWFNFLKECVNFFRPSLEGDVGSDTLCFFRVRSSGNDSSIAAAAA
mmetsp:Transcript_15498/g.20180  ORF Transcript_15498/g.20180 Transcript_15498/m.20180 type:complete len:235 (-) Transcript_15498:147-851(-)